MLGRLLEYFGVQGLGIRGVRFRLQGLGISCGSLGVYYRRRNNWNRV